MRKEVTHKFRVNAMSLLKNFRSFHFVILTMSLISCNQTRRIYLANKTDQAITLQVDTTFVKGTILSEFKDALDGKRIESGGNVKINFGAGQWNDEEEENLKYLLQHTSIKKDGNTESFRLPKTLKVGHGLLIPELIVKIMEP